MQRSGNSKVRGRGIDFNPPNRFESIHMVEDPGMDEHVENRKVPTELYRDDTQSIISYNDSSDVGFNASVNPYRGCEHGCVYCYARPTHEYLGFSSGLDFETKILIKERAPELLRAELSNRKWKPQLLVMSSVTDAYQPLEKRFRLTRGCLEVLAEFKNPVGIITKNQLVTRDIDILKNLAINKQSMVLLSITTLDWDLQKSMEPRTSSPEMRFDTIQKLRETGIPVGVMIGPVIPGLTDHEIPGILERAADSGASFASYILLRLPHAVSELFQHWLKRFSPEKQQKILNRIRELREGKLNSSEFGTRMKGEGLQAQQMSNLFKVSCKKYGLKTRPPELSLKHFHNPDDRQLWLFQ
jgi:DNA repair photolyase